MKAGARFFLLLATSTILLVSRSMAAGAPSEGRFLALAGPEDREGVSAMPAAARTGCQILGFVGRPLLEPLTLGAYDPAAWSRDRRQCYTLLTQTVMGLSSIAVAFSGSPKRPAAFGAGSFDRFFRNALRSRTNRNNFFNDEKVGTIVHPLGMSALLLVSTAYGLGADAYHDAATRALPLLWGGIAANTLPTAAAKHLAGRERPFLKFKNQEAIEEFGIDEDSRGSFFSGHASTAFFSATFVDSVLTDLVRARHPDYCVLCETSWTKRLFRIGQGLTGYGLATAVAYSRIEIDKHFMSDVLVGALVGAAHGRLTYSLGYRASGETRSLEITGAPTGQGMSLTWRF